jgi:hypothetical protein
MPDEETVAVGDDAGAPPPAPSAPAPGRLTWEHGLALALAVLVLAVHDLPYVFSQQYWTDEAWVAITTRFPLPQLVDTTSSTPIGWSLLLRLVSVSQQQTGRVLPLAFAALAVLVAYWFGRRLDWPRRDTAVVGGVLAAAAVLLVPAMLMRDDLKQYTADAAMALLAVAATSRLERTWSRWSLTCLSCTGWAGMLVSHTVAFVGAAAFLSVGLVQLVRRAWRRLAEVAVTAAVSGVLMAVVYLVFDARAVVSGLTSYWNAYFLPLRQGGHAMLRFLADRFDEARSAFGLGPVWLAGVLFLAGVVTIVRLGRPATAVTVVLVWPVMLAVSGLRKYPFLDVRTSTFLITLAVAVAGIGVAGGCALLRPFLRGRLAAALAVVALAAFVTQAWSSIDSRLIPGEDVRDQIDEVLTGAAPDDVIVVSMNTSLAFAYYWPVGTPARRPSTALLQGYEPYFPDQPRIVVAPDRDERGTASAVDQALTAAGSHPGARIWLIRTHLSARESAAWDAAARDRGRTIVPLGGNGLSMIEP